MKLETVWEFATSGKVRALGSLVHMSTPFYRVLFLATAGRLGVLQILAEKKHTAESLGKALGIAENEIRRLEAWLEVGLATGDLTKSAEYYELDGALAQSLAQNDHDDVLAMMQEMAELHVRLVHDTPTLLRDGKQLSLRDQDGEVIARSSRIIEPLVREAIGRVIPKQGAVRVLEIGCGSGTYLRRMVSLNPQAIVQGIELQPEVAELAQRNLNNWGVAERATVVAQDFRDRPVDELFDVVTMHNNIYYFEESLRPALFRQVAQHLKPGGSLLLSTGCRGGSASMAVLSLWGAMTQGCGRLPTPEELCGQLREAGFQEVESWHVGAPLDSFWAFRGK